MNRTLDRPALIAPAAAPFRFATADVAINLVERQLLDGLERTLRNKVRTGWALLILHLSRLPGAGPRPHHCRVAAALLNETAERYSGQSFALGDGDIALLFRPPDEGAATDALLAQLFKAEAPDISSLRSLWPLPAAAEEALGAVRTRAEQQERKPPRPNGPAPRQAAQPDLLAAPLPTLLTRQVAVRLQPGQAQRIVPAFREIGTAGPLLAKSPLADDGEHALLPEYVTARLDRRVLDAALLDLGARGPMTGALLVPLHLNLSIAGVMSEEFARFATGMQGAASLQVSIEVPLAEVVADPGTAILARERVRLAGMRFVLDEMTAQSMLASRPEVLDPYLVKLAWSPLVAQAGLDLPATVARVGARRMVLYGCETESALLWALGVGIRLVQGSFVDTMLAAERLRLCPAANACTIGLCRDRAATLDGVGRAGCRNPALLDRAAPAGPA